MPTHPRWPPTTRQPNAGWLSHRRALLAGGYYVYDGHHRVAAARALGQDYIAARITEFTA